MNPIESISSVFRNYVNFSGRAQRSEFWWFTLFSFVLQAILNFAPVVGWIFSLAVLLPSLAVTARRLHDTGRSAWWLIIYPILIIGWIIGVVIFVIFVVTAVWESSPENDREIRNRLESEFGVRVSQAELEVLREACGVEEELSEEERAEKEAVCDEITGSWTGTIGAVIFLIIWGLVSFAGVVTILILCAMPGTRGPNRYGPDPLQPDSGAGGGYGYESSSDPLRPYVLIGKLRRIPLRHWPAGFPVRTGAWRTAVLHPVRYTVTAGSALLHRLRHCRLIPLARVIPRLFCGLADCHFRCQRCLKTRRLHPLGCLPGRTAALVGGGSAEAARFEPAWEVGCAGAHPFTFFPDRSYAAERRVPVTPAKERHPVLDTGPESRRLLVNKPERVLTNWRTGFRLPPE